MDFGPQNHWWVLEPLWMEFNVGELGKWGSNFGIWPMQAEQHLNAKYLVEELEVGLRVPNFSRDVGNVVERTIISKRVRELMGGQRGKQAGEKAMELTSEANRVVPVGGSSYKSLNELIEQIGDATM